MTDVTPQMVLDLPLPDNDAGAATVRGYLIALLTELWRQEGGFSSSHPFGNSDWQYDLYVPLARAGYFTGLVLDDDGYVDEFPAASMAAADILILSAIASLENVP